MDTAHEKETPKKAYGTPSLKVYGNIRVLTGTGSMGNPLDGGGGGSNKTA